MKNIEAALLPVLERDNVELVDLSFQKEQGGWVLRFYLDKPGGITLDDCGTWSDKISTVLDGGNWIEDGYTLEVSSPGLYRPLKKLKDFERFMGQRIRVKLYNPLEGQKNFLGLLLGADEENIRLQTDIREVTLPRQQVAKANLDPMITF